MKKIKKKKRIFLKKMRERNKIIVEYKLIYRRTICYMYIIKVYIKYKLNLSRIINNYKTILLKNF